MALSTLFVVIDPTTDEQMALARAEQIAVDTQSRVHLFCCDYIDDFSAFSSKREAKQSVMNSTQEYLDDLAEPLRKEGLNITTEAYWNHDWQTSVIRASARIGADIILKSSSPHSGLERTFTRTSDITLLRGAPCALLLVNNDDPWSSQKILAALALEPNDSQHDRLNTMIINQSHRLAAATLAELHCVIAMEPEADLAAILEVLVDDYDSATGEEQHIAEWMGISAERVHIRKGTAKDVITDVAEELRADTVVLGTVARKGLKALLLGNTAEKVLDQLDTDLLVIN